MCNQTTCLYWYSYGDGSLSTGDFVYDTITMDGINGQKQQVRILVVLNPIRMLSSGFHGIFVSGFAIKGIYFTSYHTDSSK